VAGEREVEVELSAFQARWLDAQEHSGMNIGETRSHSIFIELREPALVDRSGGHLGPDR